MSKALSTQSTGPKTIGAHGPPNRGRGVTAVLGPTNTGKTHLAIERMLSHEVGIIGLPLRLLAREVYEKVLAKAGPGEVALITGEEKIKPPRARFFVCTVEAMPQDLDADFVAIDEIQLAADGERGHVFTNRLFHARGASETLLLGAATMRDAIRELLPGANLVSRPRMSKLTYAGEKKITRLPRRAAIVAFSANDVYAIAELVRRQRGGAAVVLGALSPRTRNAQVALYQNGDVDYIVATDAIGMGLNLDVDHVAFAGVRKFDGHTHRNLTPSEIGQIAGRAGRHMNDGTFGVTGQAGPFDAELIERLENHSFDQVGVLQWRSRTLDTSSIEALKESLRETPVHPRLIRSRMVDDVIALENVTRDETVCDMARSPAAVSLLWDMCQIPDYQRVSPADHADLVGALFGYVMSDEGKIPEDWFARQVAQADRTEGDLDTLSNRLAQIRTWTFVSHRAQWLHDPEHWQERTRSIEDKLSDALHERLTQRFVDRRTSVLMRRLRDKEEMMAEIGEDGQILVENHYVGRLDGFRFTPDPSGEGIHGKAARNAATQILASELAQRADALGGAADEAIALSGNGRILWQGCEIGRLTAGETALKPRIEVFADENLSAPDKERVAARLDAWLSAYLDAKLKPLMDLSTAEDLTGLARGLAFRLTENLGVLRREGAAEDIKALDQSDRGQLRKYGVRFGAFNLYFPALLKPAAAELLLQLWALHGGTEHGIDIDAMPERPQQGLTSVPANDALPEPYWRAAGFHVAGGRAVRIDMLERLSDLIRARVTWRETPKPQTEKQEAKPAEEAAAKNEEAPDAKVDEGTSGLAATPTADSASAPNEAAQASPAAKPVPEVPQPPSGATGDGGFRVVPELMSMVGCSGEEFASILRGLGFRLERRRIEDPAEPQAAAQIAPESALAQQAGATSSSVSTEDGGNEKQVAPVEAEPAFDEIWRPAKRRHQQAQHQGRKGRHRGRASGKRAAEGADGARQQGKPEKKGRPQGKQGRKGGKRERFGGKNDGAGGRTKEWSASPKRDQQAAENSPFAALKDLRDSLASRSRSGQS
ncbi:MAG: helicase-related protein [Methyloceanibacter sp.]|nr:helicase-related protein [Methyloceanibacter sp.]